MADGSYPARLGIDAPLEVKNWRPLVHWILAIPQLLIANALRSLRQVITLIAFFTVLFTKKIPDSLFNMIVMSHRYSWRVASYALWMREPYPPFSFVVTPQDDGTDPAWLSIDYQQELNRWAPLYKWLLAIPHFIVLIFLWIVMVLVLIISFFAVLFTGKWPEGLRRYVVGVMRWGLRVSAYVSFLRDEYPPFSLENGGPAGTPVTTTAVSAPPTPPSEPPAVPPPPPAG